MEPPHRHQHRRRAGVARHRRGQPGPVRPQPATIIGAMMRAALAAVFLIVSSPLHAQEMRAHAPATFTILHFNDVYEITPVEAGKSGGLARVARYRAELKAVDPTLLTTLGGDYVSPSALGTARVGGEALRGK